MKRLFKVTDDVRTPEGLGEVVGIKQQLKGKIHVRLLGKKAYKVYDTRDLDIIDENEIKGGKESE